MFRFLYINKKIYCWTKKTETINEFFMITKSRNSRIQLEPRPPTTLEKQDLLRRLYYLVY